MKRVLLWTTLCCLIIGTLTAVSVLHSQANVQPTLLETLGYGMCQGKPCYRGIIPGVTTWSEVKTLLADDQNAVITDKIYFTSNDEGIAINGSFTRAYGPLGQPVVDGPNVMYIDPGKVNIPLRDIIQQYGIPCGVSAHIRQCYTTIPCVGIDAIFLNYPMMRVAISHPDSNLDITRLPPDFRVTSIFIFDPSVFRPEPKTCSTYFPDQSINTPWLGFASIQRYLQYPTNSSVSAGSN